MLVPMLAMLLRPLIDLGALFIGQSRACLQGDAEHGPVPFSHRRVSAFKMLLERNRINGGDSQCLRDRIHMRLRVGRTLLVSLLGPILQ